MELGRRLSLARLSHVDALGLLAKQVTNESSRRTTEIASKGKFGLTMYCPEDISMGRRKKNYVHEQFAQLDRTQMLGTKAPNNYKKSSG